MKKGLEHYFKVLKEEKKPNFQKTKQKQINFNENQEINELWKKHKQRNYSKNSENNYLDLKTTLADKLLENCGFCKRNCEVNRRKKETGYCGVKAVSRYSNEFLHHGEEPELIPSHTIFFKGCTMKCNYCQNWEISTTPQRGTPAHPKDLAKKIIRKKLEGAKNVNFVGGDPTPHLHTILKTLNTFDAHIPIIWNSNMYMSQKTMKLLEGLIDLYLGDFRYGNDECAKKHSDTPEYTETIKKNFKEADEQTDVLVRHLVLPNHVDCCTKPIIEWCAENLGKEIRFNLMFQYRPNYKSKESTELNRTLTQAEKQKALDISKKAGLNNLVNRNN